MISASIERGGFGPDEPLVVGLQVAGRHREFVCRGTTGRGDPVTPHTRVYTASISKQFLGVCAALLVRSGELDVDAPLSDWLPHLPPWAREIRLQHLIHHTSGLPEDVQISADVDRTTGAVLDALAGLPQLPRSPGSAFAYSNAGYVCLAAAIETAAGAPFPEVAESRVFRPLGMVDSLYWPGPDPSPARSAPLRERHPAPLSLGDGGAWSTADDLLRWNQAMNADELGVVALVQSPGRLADGTLLDYGWGIGIRTHAGYRVYRHGGGWPGQRLLLARVPERDAGLVVIALADDTERRITVADALLEMITLDPLRGQP